MIEWWLLCVGFVAVFGGGLVAGIAIGCACRYCDYPDEPDPQPGFPDWIDRWRRSGGQ